MGTRTSHAPGLFSWVDLMTSDPEAAKAFYVPLFGWDPEDLPAGEAGVYTMMRIGGDRVAALSGQPPYERDAGIPPHWNSYVTVESADGTAARAGELGGTVLVEPFDVFDAGRMAVLQDPQGAVFMVWQAGTEIGAERVNEPGCLVWNDLVTPEPEAAGTFYGGLFRWEVRRNLNSPQPYWEIRCGERLNGGVQQLGEAHGGAPHWMPYFHTADAGATAAVIAEQGGTMLVPPTDVGFGTIAVARDPQGAVFALFGGDAEP